MQTKMKLNNIKSRGYASQVCDSPWTREIIGSNPIPLTRRCSVIGNILDFESRDSGSNPLISYLVGVVQWLEHSVVTREDMDSISISHIKLGDKNEYGKRKI